MYSHNQSEDSNNDPEVIDSYFLPGGIFDPEDDEQLPDEKEESEIQSRLERLALSNQTYDDRSNTNTLDNRDSFGGQLLFHSQRNNSKPQENSRIGVSALDPTADDVVGGNVGGRDLIMNVNPSSVKNGPSLYNDMGSNDWFARQQSQQMPKQQRVHASGAEEQQQSDLAGLLMGTYHHSNGSNRVPAPIGVSQYQHSSEFPKAHASFSSNSNGSHATSGGNASSSVKNGNPWSNQDLSSLKQMNSTGGRSESMQKSAIVNPPPQDNIRPPPGFSVGTQSSNNNTPASHAHGSQSPPSHSHLHSAQATSRHAHQHQHQHDPYIQQAQQQQSQQKQYLQTRSHTPTIPERRELKPEPVRDTMYPQAHHAEHATKPQQYHQKQQIHTHHPQSPMPNSPRKKHHDDDLNSLNTIKSRDVPSTIYVEEDAVSTSEDTLTVCADSVTDASVSVRTTKVEKEERMDVVEETSNDQSKKTKPKRNRKKKSKSKKQQQKGAKMVEEAKDDYSFQEDEGLDVATSIQKEEESEESSKQTRKPKKFYKKPAESKAKYATSRSSDTTTAMSSAATTVHRKTTSDKHHRSTEKKTRHEKSPPQPREPLTAIIMRHIRSFIPIAISAFLFGTKFMAKASKGALSYSISLFPKKERFWFIFPICCISIDIFFLILSGLCKLCGHFLYCMVLVHKLAVIELMESDYVTLCYSTIFFYPKLVDAFKASFTYQDYWPVLVRWIILNQWFCRPITMKDTFLYKLKKQHEKDSGAMDVMKRSLIGGDPFAKSFKNTVDHIVRKSKEDELEESERVIMANQILSIIRKVIPLILILDMNIHKDGFLVLMTNTERILFGYGFAVLRSGYLFSPLIWISWTIQLTIIMFAYPNTSWSYSLFLMGLVSIRLSHFSCAVEDLEGVNGMNTHATSKRRKMAAFSRA